MKKAHTTSLQITFLIAVCCAALTPAQADVVPWLTGTFHYEESYVQGGPMHGWVDNLPYGYLALDYVANLTYDTTCIDVFYCITNYSGPIVGGGGTLNGVLSPFDPNTVFNLNIVLLGGYIEGQTCEIQGTSCGDDSQFSSYLFKGIWNTNWVTFGYGSEAFFSDALATTGNLYMTTYSTPEPSSMTLLGVGVVGVAGVLRRKVVDLVAN